MNRSLRSYAIGCICSLVVGANSPVLAQSLQVVGSTAGPANDPRGPIDAVAAAGRLYTANFGNSSLGIYDVSQPASPRRVSVLASPGRPRTVLVSGNRAYLACYGTGGPLNSEIQAVDVSSATAPVEIRRVTLPGGPLTVDATSSLVCAVSPAGTLYVLDATLTQLSTVALPAPGRVALNGQYAYVVVNTNAGTAPAQLRTYDLGIPTAPVLVNTITLSGPGNNAALTNGYKMVPYNGALFVPGTGDVLSLANPAAPVRQTTLSYGFNAASGFAAYSIGRDNTAAKSTVLAYDVRNPFAPALAATALSSTTNNIDAVTGLGDYVYALTSSGDYLQVYRYIAGPLAAQAAASTAAALYPNPSAAAAVTLRLPATTPEPGFTMVYDAQGRLVHKQAVPGGSTQVQLDLTALAPVLYLVRCGDVVEKLVRQ